MSTEELLACFTSWKLILVIHVHVAALLLGETSSLSHADTSLEIRAHNAHLVPWHSVLRTWSDCVFKSILSGPGSHYSALTCSSSGQLGTWVRPTQVLLVALNYIMFFNVNDCGSWTALHFEVGTRLTRIVDKCSGALVVDRFCRV